MFSTDSLPPGTRHVAPAPDAPDTARRTPGGLFHTDTAPRGDYSSDDDGLYRSTGGDSYVAIVEFTDPVRDVAVMSYGNANQAHTGHVGDQLRLLAEREIRVVWSTRADVEANPESRTVF